MTLHFATVSFLKIIISPVLVDFLTYFQISKSLSTTDSFLLYVDEEATSAEPTMFLWT